MSMILDALTRAEHERQLEKQPDLKFVTPVKPQQNKPNKIWLYIGLGVLANALILFFIIRTFSGSAENEIEMAASSNELNQNLGQTLGQTLEQSMDEGGGTQGAVMNTQQQASIPQAIPETSIQGRLQNTKDTLVESLAEDRPLAMEANSLETPEVDRPLFYESKQPEPKLATPKPKPASTSTNSSTSATKGKVSFSSTELSADDAMPISNKPKLLIDQGDEASNSVASERASSGFVPNARDLPESSRASLNQYEVNVHVFDDNPTRRFVLINMDKYKEGDRIANNGPLVEEITSKGVVVNFGNGRALLPSK